MGAAELIMRARARTVVCVGDVVEVLTLLDQTVAQIIGTPGEFYWGGAASTAFFVNPNEDLIMIFLTQLSPSSTYPIRRELRATIYSALGIDYTTVRPDDPLGRGFEYVPFAKDGTYKPVDELF